MLTVNVIGKVFVSLIGSVYLLMVVPLKFNSILGSIKKKALK